MNDKFYDGTKLLSLKDVNGNTPEIYMCTTNRSAGKTTYFNRYCVKRFLEHGEKFCIIVRFDYELDGIEHAFFDEIGRLFFRDKTMTSVKRCKGIYTELFLDNLPCGYAVALNKADAIKKRSHLLADTKRLIMDEFQSETNHYCPNEVKNFISIHTSIARGGGEQVKYLPVIMISNAVTILNPYFTALRVCERLTDNTKFLRGKGYVLENGFYENVSKKQKESGFNTAFENERYVAYASENVYLNDNASFIETMNGKNNYYLTFKVNGKYFAVREYTENGVLYVDKKVDMSFPIKILASADNHEVNYIMLKKNDVLIKSLRYYFEHGCFRFKDQESKQALFDLLSY